MNTLSFILGEEKKIEVGDILYFGQLWDGEGNGEELLDSGAISPDNENIVSFEIVEKNENVLYTKVYVIGID